MFLDSDIIVKLFIVPIDILGAALFYLVYLKDRKRQLNKQFGLMIVFAIVWTNFALLAHLITNTDISLVFVRIAWIATPLLFTTLYYFSVSLTGYGGDFKKTRFVVSSIAVLSSLTVSMTNLVVSEVSFSPSGEFSVLYGKGIIPFLVLIGVIIIATLIPLFKATTVSSEEREKIKYFFIGLSVFYVMNATFNILLPIFFGVSKYYYLGDYSTIVLLIAISFAIAKHQLINIKIITAEILVLAGLALLFINIFI